MKRRLALFICPDLRADIEALQSGNTKCVLENRELLDEIDRLRAQAFKYLQEVGRQAVRADAAEGNPRPLRQGEY